MKNTSTKSEHRRNVICTIVFLVGSLLIFIRHASESRWFLKREELTGVFASNDDHGDKMIGYHYRYGKFLFISDNRQRLAIRDNHLEEMNNLKGNVLWQRDGDKQTGYSMNYNSKAKIKGVLYQIEELQEQVDESGETLFFPKGVDALFDVESITWLEE